MKYKRASGIILHPTSLPGPDGIGDLGPEAYRWVNFLNEAGCALWQVLPLGPTGYGDSPYQCFSAFAGNPYLVSPALLLEDKLLTRRDLIDRPIFPEERVDFGPVINWKLTILERAYKHFCQNSNPKLVDEFEGFKKAQYVWLDDFSLFMAIKESLGGIVWNQWPEGLRNRAIEALDEFRKKNQLSIERFCFWQFLFFRQWISLRRFASEKGIKIIGDIPIFVAYDSSDAWSHPELFFLDKKGLPSVVAGVPPDYFSPTGQLWGNPLYRWNIHKKEGYSWWIRRIQATLQMVDIIRLDHFRGFAGYWEVPFGKLTAESGRWVPGPGKSFFSVLMEELGDLPIIAEDLGEITPDVIELRDSFNLPGMKVFQFSFANDPDDPFLPHNYPTNCVAYTGTHDNNTALGWYDTAPENEKDLCRRYLARDGSNISWDMIRAVWASVASLTMAPLQDLLSLGNEARMNFPSKASGNWTWRITPGAITTQLKDQLKEINYLYSRDKMRKNPKI